MRAIDLCAGVGGLSLGLQRAGFEVLGVEVDECAAVAHRRNVGPCDLADVRAWHPDWPADLVAGGVPCQPFSIAGEREGEEREDGRLWRELLRVGDECGARALLLENVRGFATWRDGGGSLFVEKVAAEIGKTWSGVSWRTFDAADYGVPQRRERVFLVAFRSAAAAARWRWPEPTHGPPGHLWLPAYRTVRDALGAGPSQVAPTVVTRSTHPGRDAGRPSRRPMGELAAALAAAGLLDRPSTTIAADNRIAPAGHHRHAREGAVRVPIQILARLQGFPEGFTFEGGVGAQARQVGNAVPPVLAEAFGRSMRAALAGAP